MRVVYSTDGQLQKFMRLPQGIIAYTGKQTFAKELK